MHPADLGVSRQMTQAVLDAAQDLHLDRGMPRIARVYREPPGQLLPALRLESNHGRNKRLAFANHERVLEQRFAQDTSLDITRCDLLAGRQHEEVLEAPSDAY